MFSMESKPIGGTLLESSFLRMWGYDLQLGSVWFLSCLKSGVEFENQQHLRQPGPVSDC